MLTPNYLKQVEKQAINIYGNLELEIIQEIAERIVNVGYANTVVKNDVMIAQQMGVLYNDIVKIAAKESGKSFDEIRSIFEDAGATTIKNDDKIYKMAGLDPIAIKQDKSMMDFLLATVRKTDSNLENLVMTTATSSQESFFNAMNQAYMEISTGVKSYSQAIIDAVDSVAQKGASVIYPSGHKTSVENAVRMNIVTGVNQTCGKLQQMRAEELGWDLMEIDAHANARPSHAEWQGKVVSLSGKAGYLSLEDIEYGEITGFKGINCYHDWRPYYEGSARTYTDQELEDLKNESVVYNGNKMSKYDATQIQRQLERQIRQDKKELAGLQGILTSTTNDNKLLEDTRTEFARRTLYYNSHKKELNSLVQQILTKNDNTRLYIGKQEKVIGTQIGVVTKIANKYNNSGIIGMNVNSVKIQEIGEHIISRTYGKKVSFEDVEDTLKNPVGYGKIRTDNSQQIKGAHCTVVLNTKTGKLITVYPKNN